MILSLQEIGFDSPRGGVSVVIEKGIDKTNSHLLIQRATSKDSGTYRCSPTNTVQAEIKIHVLKGSYAFHLKEKSSFLNGIMISITQHNAFFFIFLGKNPDAWLTNAATNLYVTSNSPSIYFFSIMYICVNLNNIFFSSWIT